MIAFGQLNPNVSIPAKQDAMFWQVVDLYEGGDKQGLENSYIMRDIAYELYGKQNATQKAYPHVRIARKYFFQRGIIFTCIVADGEWRHFIPKNTDEQMKVLNRAYGYAEKIKRNLESDFKQIFQIADSSVRDGHKFLDGNYVQMTLDMIPKSVTTMDYEDYLDSEHWKSVREAKLSEVSECEGNGPHEGELQVHHKHYDTVGKEQMEDLIVLCRACHKKTHNIVK